MAGGGGWAERVQKMTSRAEYILSPKSWNPLLAHCHISFLPSGMRQGSQEDPGVAEGEKHLTGCPDSYLLGF
jgi:hypothetical protein